MRNSQKIRLINNDISFGGVLKHRTKLSLIINSTKTPKWLTKKTKYITTNPTIKSTFQVTEMTVRIVNHEPSTLV